MVQEQKTYVFTPPGKHMCDVVDVHRVLVVNLVPLGLQVSLDLRLVTVASCDSAEGFF